MRLKMVLYNPHAVFFTMPLALLAIGSELDPHLRSRDYRARLEAERSTPALALEDALCLGVTVLTGAPISDACAMSRAAKGRVRNCRWCGAAGTPRCLRASAC